MAQSTSTAARKGNGAERAEIDDATADVAAQLSALKSDFAGLADAVQALTGTGAAVAKDSAKTKIAAVGEASELAAQQAVGRANEGVAAVAKYAREKPMVALAAAAGAGLLIGMLTAPRK